MAAGVLMAPGALINPGRKAGAVPLDRHGPSLA